eukprot:scpid99310/ scgid10821/ 
MAGFKVLAVLLIFELGLIATCHGGKVTISSEVIITLVEESTGFLCSLVEFESNFVPRVYFTKAGSRSLGSNTWNETHSAQYYALNFRSPTVENSGTYECNVENGSTIVTVPFKLIVLERMSTTKNCPSAKLVINSGHVTSDTANSICKEKGLKPLTNKWIKDLIKKNNDACFKEELRKLTDVGVQNIWVMKRTTPYKYNIASGKRTQPSGDSSLCAVICSSKPTTGSRQSIG